VKVRAPRNKANKTVKGTSLSHSPCLCLSFSLFLASLSSVGLPFRGYMRLIWSKKSYNVLWCAGLYRQQKRGQSSTTRGFSFFAETQPAPSLTPWRSKSGVPIKSTIYQNSLIFLTDDSSGATKGDHNRDRPVVSLSFFLTFLLYVHRVHATFTSSALFAACAP